MRLPIPEKYVEVWNAWEIQTLVLGSLLVQIFLVFLAPYRKHVKSTLVRFPIWVFYLLADSIAIYTLGNLSQSVGNSSSSSSNNSSILALWAPFLLLHLGGPDTITAFDLEDNELWLRHLIGLLVQSLLVSYVVFLSLPNNPLLVPTILMFLAGIIKYAERTRALYLASADCFRASIPTDPNLDLDLPAEAAIPSGGGDKCVSEVELVKRAYSLFNVFKCLVVDIILSYQVHEKSRDFFLKLGPERAFRVIEIELNFLYQAFYTKEAVGHTRWGYLFRSICSCSIFAAFFVFLLSKKQPGAGAVDMAITYTLFASAIGLDLLALTMLLFSDYTLVLLEINPVLQSHVARLVARLRRRSWAGKIPQFNLIGFCLNLPPPNERMSPRRHKCMELTGKLAEKLGLKEMFDRVRYGHHKRVPEEVELNDFIFRELEQRFDYAEYMIPNDRPLSMKEVLMRFKGVFELRGEWALTGEQLPQLSGERAKQTLRGLLWSVKEVDFDESLLLWHIATDLCIYEKVDPLNYKEDHHEPIEAEGNSPSRDRLQKLCKLMSDYLLYQLVMQPQMMSTAGIGSIRYEDTRANAKTAFEQLVALQRLDSESASSNRLPDGTRLKLLKQWGEQWVEEYEMKWSACGTLREWHPEEDAPLAGKSVLPRACGLAGKLMELDGESRWLVIGKVWVELLTYAAGHCTAVSHAKQLGRGGELLTSVWFLMSHLGIIQEGRL